MLEIFFLYTADRKKHSREDEDDHQPKRRRK